MVINNFDDLMALFGVTDPLALPEEVWVTFTYDDGKVWTRGNMIRRTLSQIRLDRQQLEERGRADVGRYDGAPDENGLTLTDIYTRTHELGKPNDRWFSFVLEGAWESDDGKDFEQDSWCEDFAYPCDGDAVLAKLEELRRLRNEWESRDRSLFPDGEKYHVCERCNGEGKVVNEALSDWTSEEREWDPEGFEDMMNGAFDVLCPVCDGKRVVTPADERKWARDERARAERWAEMRVGA